jgi:ATP-dependent DNA ligase
MSLNKYEFDELYGKSKDNKIKSWKIWVERYDNYSDIVINYGYTRKIESRRRITNGKNLKKLNATNHYQQAISEAFSKWTKKKEIENYYQITEENKTENVKQLNSVSANIKDLMKIYYPMLAQEFNKYKKKVSYPCYIQPKLDGYRMVYNTTSNSITTRQGKNFNIIQDTEILFKELCSLPSGYILDGELYVHNDEVSFETLGVLRKKKALSNTDKLNLNKIEYHVYDIIDSSRDYKSRKDLLDSLLNKYSFKMIKNVITYKVESEDEINNYHNKFVNEDGYEGTMIRTHNGIYKEKYRSYDLLKLKDFMDDEFEIINYTFEKDTSGADENLIIWVIKVNNMECKVRPKGSKEERKELYKQCDKNFLKFKGRKLWTKFFEYTLDGNLRFPTTKTNSSLTYIRDEVI